MGQPSLFFPIFEGGYWGETKDADERCCDLFDRHYSARPVSKRRTKGFVGPGWKIVLRTEGYDALFAWRNGDVPGWGSRGADAYCTVFRNESEVLSSELILEAERIAILRWPQIERMFTFVDPTKIASTNPGYCFKRAGWTVEGRTSALNLVVLSKEKGLQEGAR